MPIGFERGDLGGGTTTWNPPAMDLADLLDPWRHAPPEADQPEEGFWTWVEVDASRLVPVVWTRWQTRADERVCPECGPLDWLVWEDGDGPRPPLHVNCRCTRIYAF